MNPIHAHLAVNHFSLLFVLAGLAVVQWGAFAGAPDAARVGLGLIAAAGLFAFPTIWSGEGAEKALEKLEPAVEALIKAHEEAAEPAFWVMIGAGAFAAWVLWRYRARPIPAWHARAAILMGLLAVGLLARASYLGGRIRHAELDPGWAGSPSPTTLVLP